MSTITELSQIVEAGLWAQSSLNSIAESIYDVYLAEIKTQKKALKTEYPWFDEKISELERCNSGFLQYHISGNNFILTGYDCFRGETNTETDSLPLSIFIDDEHKRNQLIKEFVTSKFDSIRSQIKEQQEQEEEQQRQQYESLKEKFETK